MKKSRRTTAIVGILMALTLLLVGGSVLHAHLKPLWGHGGFSHEEHADWIRGRLTKELDLDASQQQELETIARDLLEKGGRLHELRSTAGGEMLTILRSESVDPQGIERLVNQHQEQIGEFITTAGHRLTDFVSLLNPDQRQRLAKLIEDHAECRHSADR